MAGTAVAGGLPALALGAEQAFAADETAANPVVAENQKSDPSTWTDKFRVANVSSMVVGFARQPSVNLGEDIVISASGPNAYLPSVENPNETVAVELYRLGYYGGKGGRLVWKSPAVSTWQKLDANGNQANDWDGGVEPGWAPLQPDTGLYGCANNRNVLSIPGSVVPSSGVYLIKLKGTWHDFPPNAPSVPASGESHAIVIVRDDGRPRDILAVLPTNTWQAYNYWGGRSLYTYSSRYGVPGNIVPATSTERAAKVSLDRPYNIWIADYNWVLHTEFAWIYWAERQGYDISYTEDTAITFDPAQALPASSKSVAILGHGEYWAPEERNAFEAARDAGTHIYNFGANTGYWCVRYETTWGAKAKSLAEARVLVCYKTIEGGGTNALNQAGKIDPGGATTTWRDMGKGPRAEIPGTTAATPDPYWGQGRPESALLGVQYIGDDDNGPRPLTIPADNNKGEFAGHRAWRNTILAKKKTATSLGTNLLGWEWDGIPPATDPWGATPTVKAGTTLQRLSESDPRINSNGTHLLYLQDGGRTYSKTGIDAQPPAHGTPFAHAVTYTAPSGALVFSAGTVQWSFGLGPHHVDNYFQTYADAPTDSSNPVIQQATANLFLDGGIVPATPVGITLVDGGPITTPSPSPSPNATPTPSPSPNATPTPTPVPNDRTAPDISASCTNATSRYLLFTVLTNVSKTSRTLSVKVSLTTAEKSGPVTIDVSLVDATGSMGTISGTLAAGTNKTYDLVIDATAYKRITSPYRKATATVVATDTAGNRSTKTLALNLKAT
ncbi:MAG: hypothetical protein Q7T55_00485 [Solirubrobacteraceae bacterium]|nr:hypothetical protein [Solirubrobacteraceae bacterium]